MVTCILEGHKAIKRATGLVGGKRKWRSRDKFHKFDIREGKEHSKRDGDNANDDDGQLLKHDREGGEFLGVATYFPILSRHSQLVAEVRSWYVKCR
jgi:hypothetical protein